MRYFTYKKMLKGITLLAILFIILSCNGKVKKTYYDNEMVKTVLTYRNGMLNGKAIFYFPDGTKEMECTYINDTLDGTMIRYHKNGKKSLVENYQMGLKQGKRTTYAYNGKILGYEHFVNDTLHGEAREFHSGGGPLKMEAYFDMGLFDGKWIYYDEHGSVVGIGDYSKGSGEQKSWYSNGQIKRIIHYQNNVKHGWEIAYDTQGNITEEIEYHEGSPVY